VSLPWETKFHRDKGPSLLPPGGAYKGHSLEQLSVVSPDLRSTKVIALDLYNTYPALISTYMVFTLPYAILMMTGYFNTLPNELNEAVMVDGGSNFLPSAGYWYPMRFRGLSPPGYIPFSFTHDMYQQYSFTNDNSSCITWLSISKFPNS
jgi:hypothetical protein